MRLLLTRPQEDAASIGEALRARGHVPVLAPLMEVRFRDGPALSLDKVQAILATSANGVRAIVRRCARRDLPLFAVGPQTAQTARAAGFQRVVNAGGDSAALAERAAAELDPAKGALFHAAGAETAGRLAQTLCARGFAVESAVLYEAVPVAALPETAARALRADALDGVLLFSPRSARIFADLVAAAGLAAHAARLKAYCISAATAGALEKLAFAGVKVADSPNQESMLALLPPSGS